MANAKLDKHRALLGLFSPHLISQEMIPAGSECEITPCSGDVPAWFVWCPAKDTFIDAFCSQEDGKMDEEDGMLCFCILPDQAGQELAGEQKNTAQRNSQPLCPPALLQVAFPSPTPLLQPGSSGISKGS